MKKPSDYRKVLMLGPDLENQGGIAAMQKIYLNYWDYTRFDVRHISSTRNGSIIKKVGMLIKAITRFLILVTMWRPDILHVHLAAHTSFYRKSIFIFLGKIAGLKIVLHCHASDFDSFYEGQSGLVQKYIMYVINLSDLLITVSNSWHKYFLSLNIGVPVATIYNAVPIPNRIKKGLTPARDCTILSLGRLCHRKGTYDTLKIIPMVLANHPETKFLLAGDGDIDDVRSILSHKDWGTNVCVLDWVAGDCKDQLLKQAEIFLLPSYREGLPVAILEAMSEGLPVVSTTVGGISELVVDGLTGYLVEPGNVELIAKKISLLLGDTALREKMSNEAYRRVREQFCADVMIEKLYNSYESLVSNKLSTQM